MYHHVNACMTFQNPAPWKNFLKRITYISIGTTLAMLHKYLRSSLPTWHARKDLEILKKGKFLYASQQTV